MESVELEKGLFSNDFVWWLRIHLIFTFINQWRHHWRFPIKTRISFFNGFLIEPPNHKRLYLIFQGNPITQIKFTSIWLVQCCWNSWLKGESRTMKHKFNSHVSFYNHKVENIKFENWKLNFLDEIFWWNFFGNCVGKFAVIYLRRCLNQEKVLIELYYSGS